MNITHSSCEARQLYYACLISQLMQLRRQPSNPKSISRRTLSSTKFTRAATARERSEVTMISKSNTIKFVSARDKQKKINNFFDNLTNVFNQTGVRGSHKKHHAAKINLKNKYQQFLLKKSDKTKILYWNNDHSLTLLPKIVVSADFIFNQDVFWQSNSKNGEEKQTEGLKNNQRLSNDSVQQAIVKDWKTLHKNYFVIWIIRRKNSWNKFQDLISSFDLSIHAIFYVKRKRNYTFDMTGIYEEIQRTKAKMSVPLNQNFSPSLSFEGPKANDAPVFTVFQIVKLNMKDVAGFSSYEGRIPVLIGVDANAVFLRIDGPPPGLDCVVRYLLKSSKCDMGEIESMMKLRTARIQPLKVHSLSSIRNYIAQYLAEIKKQDIETTIFRVKQEDFQYQQEQITNKIEEMKKKLIQSLINEQGRNYQFEGGSSIYNFVGEMFKRNYRILEENMLAEMQAGRRVFKKVEGEWTLNEVMLDLRINYYEMYLN